METASETRTGFIVYLLRDFVRGLTGARGGGKTDTGLVWLLYDTENPEFRALVIRQNATDLSDWVDRAKIMWSGQGIKASGSPVVFEFPSGAKIYTGHLKDENAYEKYQGHEYHRMLIEELTQIPTERRYDMLISSCRSTNPEIKPMVFATANPGGQGHKWVKRRFIDPSPPTTPHIAQSTGRSRVFVPATVDDNPTLLENDPDYVKFLDGLPEDLRQAWRLGSWEEQKTEGAIYQAELEKARQDGRVGFVEKEPHKGVICFLDLGLSDDRSIGVFQRGEGRAVRMIDSEYWNNKPWGVTIQWINDLNMKVDEVVVPHDGSKRNELTLTSFKDELEKEGFKVRILRRTKDVWADIQTARTFFSRLFINEKTCEHFIDCIWSYRREFDEKNEVFKEKPLHNWSSHFADMYRYAATGWVDKKSSAILPSRVRIDTIGNEFDL